MMRDSLRGEPDSTDSSPHVINTSTTTSPTDTTTGTTHTGSSGLRNSKRRRTTRACDDCRRKKIKCDSQQPCSSCAEFNGSCTYKKSAVRGVGHSRPPPPKPPSTNTLPVPVQPGTANSKEKEKDTAADDRVRVLEQKLQAFESAIRHFLPQFDLDKSNAAAQPDAAPSQQPSSHAQQSEGNDNEISSNDEGTHKSSRFVPLVGSADQLNLTDSGEYQFHGYSSGAAFLNLIIKQFPGLARHDSRVPFLNESPSNLLASLPGLPLPSVDSLRQQPLGQEYPPLPPEHLARDLCQYAFSRGCCLLRVTHAPSFWKLFDKLYSERPQHQETNQERRFIGLLYSVIALGSMYDVDENDPTNPDHYAVAMERGYRFYAAARLYLQDLTECSDTTTLQALTFIIQFLQSTGNLNACHTFIGIALRSALRMGFHRHLPYHDPNAIKDETRRRVFHTIRQMDIYLSTTLGLPILLHDRDIDQPWPTEVNDDDITERGILRPPVPTPSFLEAFNAHTKLMHILANVVECLYPPRGVDRKHSDATYMVSYARVREVEKELHGWHEQLSPTWRPGPQPTADNQITRVKILLRFAYAHVQLVLYRPFLQYYSRQPLAREAVDARLVALAKTGIKVCRNIIHIGLEIQRQAVLIGPYWFITYTQFFAILSLVLHVLHNPDHPESTELFADAKLGKGCINTLAVRSLAADRISTALNVSNPMLQVLLNRQHGDDEKLARELHTDLPQSIFEQLPGRLRQDKSNSHPARDRMPSSNTSHLEPHERLPKQADRQQHPTTSPSRWTQTLPFPGSSWAENQSSRMHIPMQSPVASAQNQIPGLDSINFPMEDPFAYPLLPGLGMGSDFSTFQEDSLRLPAYSLHTDMEGQLLQVQDPLHAPWFSVPADFGDSRHEPHQGYQTNWNF